MPEKQISEAHELGRRTMLAFVERVTSGSTLDSMDTDQLGDFWLGMTETCLLQVVRLKPEMVVRFSGK